MLQDDDSDWYAPDVMPAGRLHIRVYWHVHGLPERLIVARDWVQARKAWQWYMVVSRGELVPIPPKGRAGSGWADEPACWQPMDAAAWVWSGDPPKPLPVHAVPRTAEALRLRYRSMEEASDADNPEKSKLWLGDRPWWRDPSQIRYEPPGEVSLRHAEGRLMRALAHCGSLSPRLYTMTTATLLANLADHADRAAREAAEARVAAVRLARFVPLPADHGDFLTAMAWFAALQLRGTRRTVRTAWSLSRMQRVLHYRAMDKALTFAAIAYALSPHKPLSWQAAQSLYDEGIERVWRLANRKPARAAA